MRTRETRDLGITLLGATLLLFAVSYLAQCTPAQSRKVPEAAVAPAETEGASPETERGEPAAQREQERRSRPGEDNEESERVRSIGHALQTIGANPELRKTYGFPP